MKLVRITNTGSGRNRYVNLDQIASVAEKGNILELKMANGDTEKVEDYTAFQLIQQAMEKSEQEVVKAVRG